MDRRKRCVGRGEEGGEGEYAAAQASVAFTVTVAVAQPTGFVFRVLAPMLTASVDFRVRLRHDKCRPVSDARPKNSGHYSSELLGACTQA